MCKKIRVCLVTWFGSPNFGTNLQAYALQQTLTKQGYFVSIVSSIPNLSNPGDLIRHWLMKFKIYPFWVLLKTKIVGGKPMAHNQIAENGELTKWSKKAFMTVRLDFPFQIKQLITKTDCFIAGSDQIWNSYVSLDPTMYLAFAAGKKRISYASSLGANSVNPDCLEKVRAWLSAFSHISVRESSTVKVLKDLTNRDDIVCVVDPTFLLTASDWRTFARKPSLAINIEAPFILCYLIGNKEKYHEQLLRISNLTRIARVIVVPACENPCFSVPGAIVYGKATPPEFVWLIQHSSLVCTDSFHATALSINLSKPFVEFLRFDDSDTTSQNVRIKDLLHHFGLDSRLYTPFGDEWLRDIDYAKVQSTLAEDRRTSSEFLIQSIEG